MLDEFDSPVAMPSPSTATPSSGSVSAARHRSAAARLVSRAYRRAGAPLRAEVLACLLRPLGTLSLVAVASGAFAHFLQRGRSAAEMVSPEDVGRFSSDQIRELALFAHEVSPEAMLELGSLLANNAWGVTALSASALVSLYRRLQPAVTPVGRGPGDELR